MTARSGLATVLAATVLLASGCAGIPASGADSTSPVVPADLGAHQAVRGQVFAERDIGPLKLDLYLPEPANEPVPLVVYIHGGSWEGGTRVLGDGMAASGASESLAAHRLLRQGYAVATVDYRLSGVARFPAPIVDVGEAVGWLQRNAHRWNLDPGRVALWGASAGGHVASLMGANGTGNGAAPVGVRAVVNWFGPSNMSVEAERDPRVGNYARGVVQRFLGCSPTECPVEAKAASPIKNLSGNEPAYLLQHGTADKIVPVSQSLDFAAELRRRGGTVQMHPYGGVGHGFGPGPMRGRMIDTMVVFLDNNL